MSWREDLEQQLGPKDPNAKDLRIQLSVENEAGITVTSIATFINYQKDVDRKEIAVTVSASLQRMVDEFVKNADAFADALAETDRVTVALTPPDRLPC
jgi:hypothetical protein